MADEDTDDLEDQLKSVEYAHWKKNAPFLYDLVMSHTLLWPSLTVQWLPVVDAINEDFNVQHCILGTHTSGAAQDYLVEIDVAIPVGDLGASDDPESPGEGNAFEELPNKITVCALIPHDGEVNKARYMPQQQQDPKSIVIATKTVSAEVYVFDTSKHNTEGEGAQPETECRPDLRLTGHRTEGYGLAWSHLCEGTLLSGSDDGLVVTWDISATPRDNRRVPALCVYHGHTAVVEDVAWHHFNPHIFGSVGDDKQLILWDTRKPPRDGALVAQQVHTQEANSLSFNPHNPHLLATGSSDRTVALRDWRHLAEPLHVLSTHTDQVFQVSWSPNHPTILGSASHDWQLHIFDISRIGVQQAVGDADDGPPELLFVHAGQAAKLNEFSWNTQADFVVASVADDNVLQVWQVAECIRSKAQKAAKA